MLLLGVGGIRYPMQVDGRVWTAGTGPVYDVGMRYANGTTKRVRHRERPTLLTAADGTPEWLVTGVEVGSKSASFPNCFSETALTRIGRAADGPPVLPLSAPLDWRIDNLGSLGGAVTNFHARQTDKDGSIVAARLAGATHGVSDTRELHYNRTARKADATFASDVAQYVSNLYVEAARNGSGTLPGAAARGSPDGLLRLRGGPVVVSSVMRPALYAAEALHAPLLLGQVIAFADTWASACNASLGGDGIVMVGWDGGYDGLWLWLKPATARGVPAAHKAQLALASELLLVAATDPETIPGTFDCAAHGHRGGGVLYVTDYLSRAANSNTPGTAKVRSLYNEAMPLGPLPTGVSGATLRQWEWGLPRPTIEAYRAVWVSLGKPTAAMSVVELGVVPAFGATPALWRAYLAANGRQPRGMSLYSYWMAQPSLDRADLTLPVPSYAFWKPDFTPVFDAAKAALMPIIRSHGTAATAAHTRLFVNDFGSTTDVPEGVDRFLNETGLAGPGSRPVWVSTGTDVPELACHGLPPSSPVVPCAHAVAASVLAKLPTQTWAPLSVEAVVAVLRG